MLLFKKSVIGLLDYEKEKKIIITIILVNIDITIIQTYLFSVSLFIQSQSGIKQQRVGQR